MHYSCNAGFYLVGNSYRRCQSDGSWSPTSLPTCVKSEYLSCITSHESTHIIIILILVLLNTVKTSCPCPSSPTNGFTSCNESHLAGIGTRVTYSCNSGYTLSGSSYRTCQRSGSWTGTAPTCVKG